MEVNLIGFDFNELKGILRPLVDPSNEIINDECSKAILMRVVEAIHLNNEQITKDLAKAGVIIPD